MKNAFFNKRGDVIIFLLMLIMYLGIIGFFAYKQFAKGNWILGAAMTIVLFLPELLVLVLIKKDKKMNIERKPEKT